MSDTITYNGITMVTPNLEIISAEAVYDSADASVVFTKFRLRVVGTISAVADSWSVPWDNITSALLVPRKTLTVTLGGDTPLFDIQNGDDYTGPLPRRADSRDILSGQFGLITWECDVMLQEKCATPSNIISHVYSTNHQIDSSFYTTRTTRGTIIVRQSASSNNPDALRGLVAPVIPGGFRRDSMNFLLYSDGLRLDYEFIDKEVYNTAPLASTEADGQFSVQMDNLVWYNHFYIRLRGSKLQSKLGMFNAAYNASASRINYSTEFVKQCSIQEDLYNNVVSFQVTTQACQRPDGAGQNVNFFPQDTQIFTAVNGSTGVQTNFGPYGTALLSAAKVAFYDPCSTAGENIAAGMTTSPSSPTQANAGQTPDVASANSTPTNNLSAAQTQAPYISWEQRNTFRTINGVVCAPSCMAGQSGLAIQIHNPYMIMTQEGSAVRDNMRVDIPLPTVADTTNGDNPIVVENTPTGFAPVLLPDKKTFRYMAAWKYVILIPFSGASIKPSQKNNSYQEATYDTFFPDNDSASFTGLQENLQLDTPLIPGTIPIGD